MAEEFGEPKQIIVMRTDLNMRKGKMVAQGSHASLAVILNEGRTRTLMNWLVGLFDSKNEKLVRRRNRMALKRWTTGPFTKICVGVGSEQELLDIVAQAKAAGSLHALIKDAGRTEFGGVPTLTCAGIGPEFPHILQIVTGHLKLL